MFFSVPRRTLLATALAAASLVAVPTAPMPTVQAATLRPVAMGCGAGHSRDAAGRCRRDFNLFGRHDRHQFRRFRHRHCDRVETPNGAVRRCRI